jgi:hypothetical protein
MQKFTPKFLVTPFVSFTKLSRSISIMDCIRSAWLPSVIFLFSAVFFIPNITLAQNPILSIQVCRYIGNQDPNRAGPPTCEGFLVANPHERPMILAHFSPIPIGKHRIVIRYWKPTSVVFGNIQYSLQREKIQDFESHMWGWWLWFPMDVDFISCTSCTLEIILDGSWSKAVELSKYIHID